MLTDLPRVSARFSNPALGHAQTCSAQVQSANRVQTNGLPVCTPVPSLRFEGIPFITSFRKDGLELDIWKYFAERETWDIELEARMDELNRRSLGGEYPYLQKILKDLKLRGHIGIPPMVYTYIPESGGYIYPHGALARLIVDTLNVLPKVDSAEAAIAQLEATTRTISRVAVNNAKDFPKQWRGKSFGGSGKPGIPPNTFRAPRMTVGGFPMKPFKGKAYSSLQTSHMVIITPNGATQILRLPSHHWLKRMILEDPVAQEKIRELGPLKVNGHRVRNVEETLRILSQERRHKQFLKPQAWTDVHTLFATIPFDIPRHIKNGYLTPLLDKPGTDDATVWDALGKSITHLDRTA